MTITKEPELLATIKEQAEKHQVTAVALLGACHAIIVTLAATTAQGLEQAAIVYTARCLEGLIDNIRLVTAGG